MRILLASAAAFAGAAWIGYERLLRDRSLLLVLCGLVSWCATLLFRESVLDLLPPTSFYAKWIRLSSEFSLMAVPASLIGWSLGFLARPLGRKRNLATLPRR